jgi:ABC-2 type transport system ATP-binding protein
MEAQFRDCINEERHNGQTVLLASHILAEVEALADRVSIVRKGRIVESGTLEELRHLTRTTISAGIDGDPSSLAALSGVHDLRIEDHRVQFEVDSDQINDVLAHLVPLGIHSLISHPPTIEELFLRHYQDDVTG